MYKQRSVWIEYAQSIHQCRLSMVWRTQKRLGSAAALDCIVFLFLRQHQQGCSLRNRTPEHQALYWADFDCINLPHFLCIWRLSSDVSFFSIFSLNLFFHCFSGICACKHNIAVSETWTSLYPKFWEFKRVAFLMHRPAKCIVEMFAPLWLSPSDKTLNTQYPSPCRFA